MTDLIKFRLYDQKGRPFVKGLSYYKDETGRLIQVPSMFGPRERILSYLRACFETSIGIEDFQGKRLSSKDEDQIVGYLEEFWAIGEQRMKEVMGMLDRRALELKDARSIRHLLYSKTREILGRLTIPIFNRQQLENIPNIPNFIIDEIDEILHW